MPGEGKNTGGQMRRSLLEFAVLLIVSKSEAYASDIIEKLDKAHLLMVEGTLYPLLNRLLKFGFVEYLWKESESGPPRKYYRLSTKGKLRLRELSEEWKNLKSSLANLEK
jgi:PadR family transcriptional regulator PadR